MSLYKNLGLARSIDRSNNGSLYTYIEEERRGGWIGWIGWIGDKG